MILLISLLVLLTLLFRYARVLGIVTVVNIRDDKAGRIMWMKVLLKRHPMLLKWKNVSNVFELMFMFNVLEVEE